MSGGKTKMANHPVNGYDIHPVFYDLLEGIEFDLRVGESGASLPCLHIRANHETFRKFGDSKQRNFIRPYN